MTRPLELPAKLFFRIGEVASLVGVEPHVLRYWEREFRSIRPTKSAKGQRVYSRKDVENLLRVRDLLYRDGFTIAGAKKKLHEPRSEPKVGREDEIASIAAPSAWGPEGTLPQRSKVSREEDAIEEDALDVLSPVSGPRLENPRVREKLVALRTEIEAFLAELTASSSTSSGRS